MAGLRELKAVEPQPGRPLYEAVKQAIRDAVDAGMFAPGEQMPSTKELSERLSVSLVTAHRALQELVSSGVLERSQGKGTFVREGYAHDKGSFTQCRVGLVFHRDVSLADYFHSQVLEGVRQAAQAQQADVTMLRFGDDTRQECAGYLLVNPLPADLELVEKKCCKRLPAIVIGAHGEGEKVGSIDIDHIDLAKKAVEYLSGLGHRKVAFVGGPDQGRPNYDRWTGFARACEVRAMELPAKYAIKGKGWRLNEQERGELAKLLSSAERPTAVFAAGYFFALDVYEAAAMAGLKIPTGVSVVGVDDPPSAALLAPALTTLKQPLVKMGSMAMNELIRRIMQEDPVVDRDMLKAELVVRNSAAAIR